MQHVYLLFVFILYFLECCVSLKLVAGWEYLNLHCRDNNNEPVDWWYMYKPPSNIGPTMESGINFTYIASNDESGRLTAGRRSHIFSNGMLRYTMAPMFNVEYLEYMALVVYEGREPKENFKGSASLGIMMANAAGGIWIGHTVHGFPDLKPEAPIFPPEELKNGHMLMCLTLDLATLNSLAIAIKQTEPSVPRINIPVKLKPYLPEWGNLMIPDKPVKISKTSVRKTKVLHFVTRDKSLRGLILARSPGDTRCLYKSFAKTKGIVMDVYGHKEHNALVECDRKYSIRNINSIALKFTDQEVYYITNSSDSMGFAVSTGGAWQRSGISKHQYWMCTGNIENQPPSAKGGIVACASNFQIWRAFDILKVTEPQCPPLDIADL